MAAVDGDLLTLTQEDDGKLFVVQVMSTGEQRIARYHFSALAGFKLKFPCFAYPDQPEDYRLWLHEGWGGQTVRRV